MKKELFTIGHTNHSMQSFIELLHTHGITAVADIRSRPYSKFVPWFNSDNLMVNLKKAGIDYVFLGKELGARRDEKECYVNCQAKYDLIAKLPLFHKGLQRVRNGLEKYRVALMCSEKDPLDCHRTILVCRNLRHEGININHVSKNGKLEAHFDAESRLMKQLNIQPNLFNGSVEMEDLIEKAYDIQSERIAYRKDKSMAITIYTIGFTKKTAEQFFGKLKQTGVKCIVDIRLHNNSQLAGFAKGKDLKYFLHEIGDIDYLHVPLLAPTDEILKEYKKRKGDWLVYEQQFLSLMAKREIEKEVSRDMLHEGCLLCSEATPDFCHRRLVVEYLQRHWDNVEVHHII